MSRVARPLVLYSPMGLDNDMLITGLLDGILRVRPWVVGAPRDARAQRTDNVTSDERPSCDSW
jgi:hypothetical protein